MKIFDEIELRYDVPELAESGVCRGCTGDVIEVFDNKCKVIFYAPRIYGDYVIAIVDEDALSYKSHMDERLIEGFKKFVETIDESKHTCFLNDDVHEYDVVQLMVEKEEYAKHGVHRGMTGTVMMDVSYYNKWYVIFESTDGSGEDIADLDVHRDDFKVIGNTQHYAVIDEE